MRAVYIEGDKVINTAKWEDGIELPKGWVESRVAQKGWGHVGGVLFAPEIEQKEKTTQEKIEHLENTITPRMIRGALIGDQFSIDKIKEIECLISDLRLSNI